MVARDDDGDGGLSPEAGSTNRQLDRWRATIRILAILVIAVF
jgi:hypothetical protein